MTTSDAIRQKIQDLARDLGRSPRPVTDDDVLPQTGLLDSAAILELILWVETEYDIEVPQEDFTLDNLGSIRQIVAYIDSRRA